VTGPDRFWQKELVETARSRRAFALKFLLPLVLLVPLALAAIPASMKAVGFSVAVLFIGVFGASVRLIHLREGRMLERMAVLPVSSYRLSAEYILAGAFLDGVQLLLPLILLIAASGLSASSVALVLLTYPAALIGANALGVLVASLSASAAEGHLFAILSVIGAAALSGLAPPGAGMAGSLWLLPFGPLAATLGASADATLLVAAPIAWLSAAVLLGFVLAASPRLFRSR
jgi:hypothetical protein